MNSFGLPNYSSELRKRYTQSLVVAPFYLGEGGGERVGANDFPVKRVWLGGLGKRKKICLLVDEKQINQEKITRILNE